LFIGNLHRRYRVGSLWLFHEATLVVTNVDQFQLTALMVALVLLC